MIEVIVSPEARDDIDNITDYSFRTFGVDIAVDYMAGMTRMFQRLAVYPGLGAILPKIRPPVHGFIYRSHQIIYDSTAIVWSSSASCTKL